METPLDSKPRSGRYKLTAAFMVIKIIVGVIAFHRLFNIMTRAKVVEGGV